MPIPLEDIERSLLPRVLTPESTVAELLYLYAEDKNRRWHYAVIRVADHLYDVLMLDDLQDAAQRFGDALPTMALAAVPDLLKPAAPLYQHLIGGLAATQRKNASPHRRLVILDRVGVLIGVLGTRYMGGSAESLGVGEPKDPARRRNPLDLINPPAPAVLGDESAQPPAPPFLNTRFDGRKPNEPLIVGQRTPLIIWIGEPTSIGTAQTSRPCLFDFGSLTEPVTFTVRVDANEDVWTIRPLEATMIVDPTGKTTQEAEFSVMARREATAELLVSILRDGITIQHIWLSVIATEAGSAAARVVVERTEASFPIDARLSERPTVEMVIREEGSGSRVVVDAHLPTGEIYKCYNIPASDQELQVACGRLRDELRKLVHFRGTSTSTPYPFASESQVTVDEALARSQCIELAKIGRMVYRMLLDPPDADADLKELASDLRTLPEGSRIKIVIAKRSFIIPWAFLYDSPGVLSPETLDWRGFWGYRYILDVFPQGRYPTAAIADATPGLLMLLNDEGKLKTYTTSQAQFAQQTYGIGNTHLANGADAVVQALKNPPAAALVYCYCHGVHASDVVAQNQLAAESALFFGSTQRLRLDDMRDIPAAHLISRPLVFVNACEGATQYPFYYDGFMPFFIQQQGARGFVGTEVQMPQLLGHEAGLMFLRMFAQGLPVGEIFWKLRRHYLDKHHNIVAFNYTLYCPAETRLARPPLAPDAVEAVTSTSELTPAVSLPSQSLLAADSDDQFVMTFATMPTQPVLTEAAPAVAPELQHAIPAPPAAGDMAGATMPWALPELTIRVAALNTEVDTLSADATSNTDGQGIHHSQLLALKLMMNQLLQRQNQLLKDIAAAEPVQITGLIDTLQREIVGAHGLWRLFRAIFDQRNSERTRPALDTADLVAANCYLTCMRQAEQLQVLPQKQWREPPLTFLDAHTSALTVSRNARAQEFAMAVGPYRSMRLPIPIILLPSDHLNSCWLFSALHHEVGHNLDQDLRTPDGKRISEEISTYLGARFSATERRMVWTQWSAEIVADAFGVLLGGAGFACTLTTLLLGQPLPAEVMTNDPHPDNLVRLRLLEALLRRLGVPQLDAIAGWVKQQRLTLPIPTGANEFLGECDGAAEIVFATGLDALRGQPLSALVPTLAADAKLIEELAAYLLSPRPDHQLNPALLEHRMIPAAAQLAVAQLATPSVAKLESIHKSALIILASIEHPPLLGTGQVGRNEQSLPNADFLSQLVDEIQF